MTDSELLRRYAQAGDESAFAELVRRHVALVYHAACRQTFGRAAMASDVTQAVFTDLARKAQALSQRPALAGWLYTSTRFAAAKACRSESRRRHREQEAHRMQDLNLDREGERSTDWLKLRPLIDEALHTLGDEEREAVLLRYFEGRAFAEIGSVLGSSEEGARKRVDRALAKLCSTLARRGVTSTSAALATALAREAGLAIPSELASTVTRSALAGAAAPAASSASLLGSSGYSLAITAFNLVVAIAALTFGLVQAGSERTAREARLHSETEESGARAELEILRARLGSAHARARAADAESATLLQAVRETAAAERVPAGATAVAFVIDTSGSMRNPANARLWSGVLDSIRGVLAASGSPCYASVYDGDGRPVLGRRLWRPATPDTIDEIASTLATYAQDTVSDPLPGVKSVLRDASSQVEGGARLQIWIIGDEFNSAASEADTLGLLDQLNPRDERGARRATLHAIQLPTTARAAGLPMGRTGQRFQSLMTDLARQHGGSYRLLDHAALK